MGNDTTRVRLKDCLAGFYAPTAFTPNNDGKNDVFCPLLFGTIKQYQFTVYNRYGEVVFKSNELRNGWNGTYKGRKQDSHVFVWTCVYQMEGEAVRSAKGTVVLLQG